MSNRLTEAQRPSLSRLASESVDSRSPARHIDWLLLLAAGGLSAFGLLVIYSATSDRLAARGLDPQQFVDHQSAALAVGVVAMVVVMLVDYRALLAWAPVLYAAALVPLGAVLVYGDIVNGSRAWLSLGALQFQPSELAKVTLIVMLAALFHERREDGLALRALVEALAISAVPMALILAQPDFGTFMVYVAIVFGVLLLARVRVRYLMALIALGVAAVAVILASGALAAYQVDRLASFLSPETVDPRGAGFNVNQAQIAIGSGRVAGQGLFQGSQTSLSYVPENHTDFIFTVVGEELGFLGCALVLGGFALLLWRALRIAALSRDTFGVLLAAGVVTVFGFQVFINVGMTVGLLPVTGLPLPLLSYGGTSLVGCFLMVGLLQNVHMRRLR